MVEIPRVILPNLSALSPIKERKVPLHIAINTSGVKQWAESSKKDLKESVTKHFSQIDECIDFQIKHESRVMTLNLKDTEPEVMPKMKEFFSRLVEDPRIHKHQIRVFVIGQWYEMDYELTETFKRLMERTKDYDNLFLNFCVRYDGQEEILGALRLACRKVFSGKLKEEDLTIDTVKENLYSSYFPPPELIVETEKSYSGLLLWDSKSSIVYFSKKPWLSMERKDYDEALGLYTKLKEAA